MPTHARHLNGIAPAMSIKYNNLVYELKQKGQDIIVLSLGEAFFDIPLAPFDDLPFPDVYHYAHSRGVPELRQQLAAYYTHRYGVPVDPASEIIVTAGSKIALHMAFMAILNPGDEVLIHEPAWVSYPEQVRLCHGVPVQIPYALEIGDFERFITSRTRAIVVNNPNNPRGRVLSPAEWERLHALAVRHDLFLVSDEAYSDFVLRSDAFMSAGALDPEKRHTIICNSMSKNYGMSGWRMGYVITARELTDQILKVNQHLVTCPATILQWYYVRHFDEILSLTLPQIRQVVERRQELAEYLAAKGVACLPGEGTFYLFVSISPSVLGSEAFCTRLLTECGVSAVPGIGYGASCDRFVRVSVGTETFARTKVGLDRLAELIATTAAVVPAATTT
jgi:aminotransferase